MANKNTKLTIGRLAIAGGVSIPTIRYYQRRGLLDQPHRPVHGGFRVYDDADIARVLQIRETQRLGFTLAEIGILLGHLQQRECKPIKALLDAKHAQLVAQLNEIKRAQKRVAELNDACRGNCIGDCKLVNKLNERSAK